MSITYNIHGQEISESAVASEHRQWYAKQPTTHCRRCDREFPNVDGDKTEFCSQDCEIGLIIPAPSKRERGPYKVPTHKRHLNVASWKSKWAR